MVSTKVHAKLNPGKRICDARDDEGNDQRCTCELASVVSIEDSYGARHSPALRGRLHAKTEASFGCYGGIVDQATKTLLRTISIFDSASVVSGPNPPRLYGPVTHRDHSHSGTTAQENLPLVAIGRFDNAVNDPVGTNSP